MTYYLIANAGVIAGWFMASLFGVKQRARVLIVNGKRVRK